MLIAYVLKNGKKIDVAVKDGVDKEKFKNELKNKNIKFDGVDTIRNGGLYQTKMLASKIYDVLLDMDFEEYADNQDEGLQKLTNDLQLLEKSGNGALLNAIKMMMEN